MIRQTLIILLVLVLISCSDENMTFDIGNKSLDVKTNIRFFDTLTINSYTVVMDSIRTSSLDTTTMMVGRYSDPEFGNITASSYFRVTLPASRNLPKDAVFDSIQLFMVYNDYYAGDTTLPYTIHVHRLKNAMKANDDNYFYNTTSIDCFPEPYGSLSFTPRPHRNDTTWITLSADFGQELFSLIKTKDSKVDDNISFQNYFKGFKLAFDESDEVVIGFQFPNGNSESLAKNPAMRLYYHYYQFERKSGHLDFMVGSNDYRSQFNHFDISEPVVSFPTSQINKVPADQYNNKSFVMAGLGIVTRFEIPFLKNLNGYHDNLKIINAVLQIEPVKGSYKTIGLPALCLYTSDSQNRFMSTVLDKRGNIQYANLKIDKADQIETWYTFDVTSFLQAELNDLSDETPSLLLTIPPDRLYKTVDRLVLGSQSNATNKVKLKVYYMFYE
jgi:hypothetical protein